MNVAEAAEMGRRELLEALRDEIARQIDEGVAARDLASLSRRLLEISEELDGVVAEEDGEPVGFCGYTNLCGEADIDHVFVAPEFRGKKLAQRLMREILKTGGEEGVEAYTLEVRVSNAPAIHLYEKFGFVSEGIRPGFYDYPREDAMIMWRRPV